MYIFNSK